MKRTGPVDHLVGARVRLRRQALDMTQTELADKIGVTFQQVQKYELGTNRVGASRLAAIAEALRVPVAYFFEDLAPAPEAEIGRDTLMEALRDRTTVELVKVFAGISDPAVRRSILELARSVSNRGEQREPEEEHATTAAAPPSRSTRSTGTGRASRRRLTA